jgi:hypothetical protein
MKFNQECKRRRKSFVMKEESKIEIYEIAELLVNLEVKFKKFTNLSRNLSA